MSFTEFLKKISEEYIQFVWMWITRHDGDNTGRGKKITENKCAETRK